MRSLVAASLGFVAFLAAGCNSSLGSFVCEDNSDCVSEGQLGGTCQSTGFCSFSNSECGPDGQRYGKGSGELSGLCVSDGIDTNDAGATIDAVATIDAGLPLPTAAYRVSRMQLLDPHMFDSGEDVTSLFNLEIRENILKDEDPVDGVLDMNLSLVFAPAMPGDPSTAMVISFADCSAPDGTVCTQLESTNLIPATATTSALASCLDEIAGTTTPYSPPVVAVPPPCFSSNAVDLTLIFIFIELPLKSVTIATTLGGTGSTSLESGLLRGFLTMEDAENTVVGTGATTAILSTLLKAQDMDMGPDSQGSGWWFYLGVETAEVNYVVP